jgi:4'-phosphopantetheinyl transferase
MISPDLQLYQARLDISQIDFDCLWQLLSEDERSRANNFKREHLKQRFVAARGNLREILGKYLTCEPSEIFFTYGDRGKPYVDGVYFNVAHSQDLAIYAICSDREVGIDLEYIDPKCPKCDVDSISQRYFVPAEHEIIKSLSDREKYLAFFQAWTLKEAYAKATGHGIANTLNLVDISPLLKKPIGETLQIDRWTLMSLDTQPSFAAALCMAIS